MREIIKEILVISVIVIAISLLIDLIYCFINPINQDAVRKAEGTVIAVHNGSCYGVDGKIIFWEEGLRASKGGGWWRLEQGEGATDNKWLVYPPEKFNVEPFHKIRLHYELIINKDDQVVVNVIKVEDLGIAEIKF